VPVMGRVPAWAVCPHGPCARMGRVPAWAHFRADSINDFGTRKTPFVAFIILSQKYKDFHRK